MLSGQPAPAARRKNMNTRQFLLLLCVIIVTQALGFALLLHRLPSAAPHGSPLPQYAPPERFSANQPDTGGAIPISPAQSAALQMQIENMLRRALADVLANQSGQSTAQPQTDSPPSSEQQEAADQAMSVINSAISAGVWTPEDNQALMPYAGRLTHAQRVEIINRFAQALQNKQLTLQGPPPAL
jgi:hypothetical protein